jgi:hypothetical protein
MSFNFFRPKPGRFGTASVCLTGRAQGNIGASGDTEHCFGSFPAKSLINRTVVSAETVPVGAGTVTAVLKKYDASANAYVTLTSAINLETLTAREGTAMSFLSTLTQADRTLDTGDTVAFLITSSSTISTQPDDLMVNTELLVLE